MIIEIDNIKVESLEVEKDNHCAGCIFHHVDGLAGCLAIQKIMPCDDHKDNKYYIFKLVE